MICRTNTRRCRNRGIAMILVTLTLMLIVPLIGLAIDGGIMYLLKARLAQAVDAACLSGARSLSRGLDIGAQTASATDTAIRYFKANFKDNLWGCTVSAPAVSVVEDSGTKTRLVTVSASATSPLYFLRMIGKSTATISATAQARRRDVNVMLVLDRSGSMGTAGAIAPMKQAAASFVNQFAPGRDNVGMVVFGGNYYLAAPSVNFQPGLVNSLNQISASGNTNTAQALWIAYQALAQLNQPGALNVILFFTDGLPNGITADFLNVRKSPTTCAKGAASLQGWIAQIHAFSDSGCPGKGCVHGLFLLGPSAGVSDSNDGTTNELITGAGCHFTTDYSRSSTDPSQAVDLDFTGMPAQDIYGNLTNPPYPYKTVDLTAIGKPSQIGAASFNAADYAAQRIRAGAINNIVPLVYCISLLTTPSEPPDPLFMIRVANVQSATGNNGSAITNPIFNSAKPVGMYIDTQHQSDLQPAFMRIASEILRLSQ